MNTLHDDVLAFHRRYGCAIGETPAVPDAATVALRCKLLAEEYAELSEAMAAGDLVQIAKEASDLKYVVEGMLIAYGIDSRSVDAEVHASNMSKDGSKRGDGKIQKGTAYRPPDIAAVLARQAPIPARLGEMTAGERAALAELEHRIGQTSQADVIGSCLREIRDRELFRGTHATFEEYAASVWRFSDRIARLHIDCAEPGSRYSEMANRIKKNLISPVPLEHKERLAFVRLCLRDPELSKSTDADIARRCEISEWIVSQLRECVRADIKAEGEVAS